MFSGGSGRWNRLRPDRYPSCTVEQVVVYSARADGRRQIRIKRIGFERGRFYALSGFQRRCNQRRRHTPLAIAFTHIEAGERPHWQYVHVLCLSRHARSSHGRASRRVSWHQPTTKSPSKASKPGGGPRLTTSRNAAFFARVSGLPEKYRIRNGGPCRPVSCQSWVGLA